MSKNSKRSRKYSYVNYSPDKPSLNRLSVNIAQILYLADYDVQKIYKQFKLLADSDLHLVNLFYHIKFLGPVCNKLRLFLEKTKILQNLNWNTFFQISTIISFSPAQYLLILLFGIYSIPYRSTTLDEFRILFHQLGLDTLFDASRLSRIFAQINPLSKGHYIVGNKIQLLLVLCPDIFKFLYEIQEEFQKHFFNKKICNRIINRLNNIDRIKGKYKNNNKFPFPTCYDYLKNLLFNISNPYQFDYYVDDDDDIDGDEDDEEEVYEYRNKEKNANSYTDDESDSAFKHSRCRSSSDDHMFNDSKNKITFINVIEKFLYVIFPSRRLINNNTFCNKMVSRCKMVGESYSVEKYPRHPSHVSGTSFLSDSGILLDRQQYQHQQQQQQQQHIFSGRALYDTPSRVENSNNNTMVGLNGIICSENKVQSGRPYSNTLNTITFNYDTFLNNNNNNNIIITSPIMSPCTTGKKTSLHSEMNGLLLKDMNNSVVNNMHQSEQLGVNYQTAKRSYTNRQYSESTSRCDYSLSPPHVDNKLNRNINPNPVNITTPTTTTIIATTSSTTEENYNNNNGNVGVLEKNKISLQNS